MVVTEACRQRGMERQMLGITRRERDRKQALWIREQTKVEDILMTIKQKKWSWMWEREKDYMKTNFTLPNLTYPCP